MTASTPIPSSHPRVLLVVNGFPDEVRPDRGIFNLRAARALGTVADVKVAWLRSWTPTRSVVRRFRVEGIPVVTLALPPVPGLPTWSARLFGVAGRRLLARELTECDVIHSVDLAFPSVVACDWARAVDKPHVAQVISDWCFGQNAVLRLLREDQVDAVACNSTACARGYAARFAAARNVRTVFRGTDLTRFNPTGIAAGPTATSPPPRFLYLGGFPGDLPHIKGGLLLLDVWRKAEEQFGTVSPSLVIAGPSSNGSQVQKWRMTLRYPERVHIVGTLPPSEIVAYMRAADVVLVPSLEEGLPNVAVEAAATGRAVMASAVGGLPDIVADGETGWLLPPGESATWTTALVTVAGDIPSAHERGCRARTRAEQRFDSGCYGRSMAELYELAIQERKSRRALADEPLFARVGPRDAAFAHATSEVLSPVGSDAASGQDAPKA